MTRARGADGRGAQGDVDVLTAKVRALIEDTSLRTRMGDAGREETLRWNWEAATSVLRNQQYTRAEKRFDERQRRRKERWNLFRFFRRAAPA